MPSQREQLDGCGSEMPDFACEGEAAAPLSNKFLANNLRLVLHASGSAVDRGNLERLASLLQLSERRREALSRRRSAKRLGRSKADVLRLIVDARDAGDTDEALWCAFIAAHSGRESANKEVGGEVESSHRFLCAFGSHLRWTWACVSQKPQSFRRWLTKHCDNLRQLSFGNHRKFESHKPERLWQVIGSFLELVKDRGGTPTTLFETDSSLTPQARHAELYERLRPLRRFGRTARIDLLSLLSDLALIDATPGSCYVVGSTGPLEGARRIWGREKSPRELGRLADELAAKLRLSPLALEDALCNWQKGSRERRLDE